VRALTELRVLLRNCIISKRLPWHVRRSVAELSPRRLTFYPSNPCEIWGDQSVIWTGFSPYTSVSPISIIPPVLSTHSFIYHRRWTVFFSQYFTLPCLYNFTKAPFSFIYRRRCVMFFSQDFSLPCQYYSTNAPYSFTHLPPTLYNVFSPSTSVFPCLYHTTNAPHSFIYHWSCTRCSQ